MTRNYVLKVPLSAESAAERPASTYICLVLMITKGTFALNQWVIKVPDFSWATKPLADAAAKATDNGAAGKTTLP